MVLLKMVDSKWMDHIDAMEELKRGIGLRSYGQQDPVVAFRQESYDIFDEMTMSIREDTVRRQRKGTHRPQGRKDRSERPLPVRKRKEIQEVLRRGEQVRYINVFPLRTSFRRGNFFGVQ